MDPGRRFRQVEQGVVNIDDVLFSVASRGAESWTAISDLEGQEPECICSRLLSERTVYVEQQWQKRHRRRDQRHANPELTTSISFHRCDHLPCPSQCASGDRDLLTQASPMGHITRNGDPHLAHLRIPYNPRQNGRMPFIF